jgi:hypothetical protein
LRKVSSSRQEEEEGGLATVGIVPVIVEDGYLGLPEEGNH